MNNTVTRNKKYVKKVAKNQSKNCMTLCGIDGGKSYEIEWDDDAKVSDIGSAVYFAQFLKLSGILDNLYKTIPLNYKSNNSHDVQDIIGTLLLSILKGCKRYSNINQARKDQVCMEAFNIKKMVSVDSVRRAFRRNGISEWEQCFNKIEESVYLPLLENEYVIDLDSTVKPLYGNQEEAEVGYNPKKPGRPSHAYHTAFIGNARLVLSVDVMSGKKTAGRYSMPSLNCLLDKLPSKCQPRLIRGDIGYGTEYIMSNIEARNLKYLFKLKFTKKVDDIVQYMINQGAQWLEIGNNIECIKSPVQLTGWAKARTCVIYRQHIVGKKSVTKKRKQNNQREFDFEQEIDIDDTYYKYSALVTNDDMDMELLHRYYAQRADCENVFDEIKNQWGWGGFVTKDITQTTIIAKFVAMVYNWWSIFVRLANDGEHLEAITSRPLLLNAIGRLVNNNGKSKLYIKTNNAKSFAIAKTLNKIGHFINALAKAKQSKNINCLHIILYVAFRKWLTKITSDTIFPTLNPVINQLNLQSYGFI